MSKTVVDMDFLNKYDAQQVSLLDEPLIAVDRQDRVIGITTKKDAHLLANIESEQSLIHRAFSLFLFDSSSYPSRLLLQQRSAEKITYPLLWTNTCCSHPLYKDIEMDGIDGVKHAAIRRTKDELGYNLSTDLIYITRIFYQARNIPDDGYFGESEIDYILIANVNDSDKLDLTGDFKFNINEAAELKLATLGECEALVKQQVTTPWFSRIVREGLLAKWWTSLDRQELHETIGETDTIIQL
ncbi:hypothetical protein I4U23_010779 [Adineta vaga]|nr:hypothetical protein I4U23_010779 [Adineta vaga]